MSKEEFIAHIQKERPVMGRWITELLYETAPFPIELLPDHMEVMVKKAGLEVADKVIADGLHLLSEETLQKAIEDGESFETLALKLSEAAKAAVKE